MVAGWFIAINELSARRPGLKVLFVSGYTDDAVGRGDSSQVMRFCKSRSTPVLHERPASCRAQSQRGCRGRVEGDEMSSSIVEGRVDSGVQWELKEVTRTGSHSAPTPTQPRNSPTQLHAAPTPLNSHALSTPRPLNSTPSPTPTPSQLPLNLTLALRLALSLLQLIPPTQTHLSHCPSLMKELTAAGLAGCLSPRPQ